MTNLQLYIDGLKGIFSNFWLVFIYIIAAGIFLWRTERNEKKRMEEIIKRKNARRIYND